MIPDQIQMNAMKWNRVLWIRLDHIGDVVMSLPMLENLRSALPHAEIDCVVLPFVEPIVRASGLRVNIIPYDSPRFHPMKSRLSFGLIGRGAGVGGTIGLLKRLRSRRYDAAFELRGDHVGRRIARAAGVPIRIGPDRQFYEGVGQPNNRGLLTHIVPLPVEARHAVLNNLDLLRVAGLPAIGDRFRFPVAESIQRQVDTKLAEHAGSEPPILVHVGSNDPLRNWTNEKWSIVLKWLGTRTTLPILLTGIPKNRELIADLLGRVGAGNRLVDAAGLFSLEELPALFSRAKLMVTVDTGPMHIAAMQGTPIVSVMRGDLVPRHHAWGQPHGAIGSIGDDLSQIAVEAVQAAVDRALA